MMWNGLLVDTRGEPDNAHAWFLNELGRRLDGTIVYSDGWSASMMARSMYHLAFASSQT